MLILDQYQDLSSCVPTPPLTQQHLPTDTKLGLKLGEGKGRCAVAQILTLIPILCMMFKPFMRVFCL